MGAVLSASWARPAAPCGEGMAPRQSWRRALRLGFLASPRLGLVLVRVVWSFAFARGVTCGSCVPLCCFSASR